MYPHSCKIFTGGPYENRAGNYRLKMFLLIVYRNIFVKFGYS